MDIAATSTNMSLAQVKQAAGVAILKKAMDVQQTTGDALVKSMENLAPPSGVHLDIRA